MITARHYIAFGTITLLGLAVLFLLTNPEELPSIVLFLVFGGIYSLIVSVTMVVILAIRRIGGFGWPRHRFRRIVLLAALLPTFLLLLRSIGQLTVRDASLAVALTIIAYLYVQRMSQKPISE